MIKNNATMKKKVLMVLPNIFSLSTNNDYTRFIPKGTIQERTEKRWLAIGGRLYSAIGRAVNIADNDPYE
jgi:hypothetical protein